MLEVVLVVLFLVGALIPLARGGRGGAVLAAVIVGGAGALTAAWRRERATADAAGARLAAATPLVHSDDGYVGSASCRSCHPGEHASWRRTHHRSMTRTASPDTILGDFDDVTLVDRGRTYRMLRDGADCVVEFVDPAYDWSRGGGRRTALADGASAPEVRRPIVLVTGSHNVQVYWVEGAQRRRLEFFPLVWKIDTAEWMPLADMFLKDPTLPEYLTTWNDACNQCHATAPRMRTSPATGAPSAHEMGTAVGELGISCEACHGPGREHVEANGSPLVRYASHLAANGDPTIVNPARLPHDRASEVCGQCHALGWHRDPLPAIQRDGARYRPGDELARTRVLMDPAFPAQRARMGDFYARNHFWDDGIVRVSGRDFSGMRKSACYTRGDMSCLSCHSMHDSEPDDQLSSAGLTERACLECHQDVARDVPAHTRHAAGSSGSSCFECHMPHVTYGLMKTIRNHWIGSPTVRDDLALGRPNACNLCHLDRTLQWAADRLHDWYGQEAVEVGGDAAVISATALLALTGDAAQRAIAADALGRQAPRTVAGEDWITPVLATLLRDPYGAVRYIAERSLRRLPGMRDLEYEHLAPPRERAAAAARVLREWDATSRDGDGRTAVLLLPDGRLDREALSRLLARRDDTPMELSE